MCGCVEHMLIATCPNCAYKNVQRHYNFIKLGYSYQMYAGSWNDKKDKEKNERTAVETKRISNVVLLFEEDHVCVMLINILNSAKTQWKCTVKLVQQEQKEDTINQDTYFVKYVAISINATFK